MTTHKPKVLSGRQLVNAVCDQDLERQYGHLFSSEGDPIGGVYDQFFVAEWPECCVTTQHLIDATVHGPYESESEAMSCHDAAEMY